MYSCLSTGLRRNRRVLRTRAKKQKKTSKQDAMDYTKAARSEIEKINLENERYKAALYPDIDYEKVRKNRTQEEWEESREMTLMYSRLTTRRTNRRKKEMARRQRLKLLAVEQLPEEYQEAALEFTDSTTPADFIFPLKHPPAENINVFGKFQVPKRDESWPKPTNFWKGISED
eukprot:TRINITY_DN12189_c0_g1_i1.p1 TRINITY_DN12189_c0_g1~~TRINITY_DN12189_c0_g1_i1.p1  ORF type:complete len:174 (-),score=46.18 TRINITY_DN12189_c0_g1_i1:65-586(-)